MPKGVKGFNRKSMKEYRAWKGMKARCYAPSANIKGGYAKQNIQVCEKWKHSFEEFLKDMGIAPGPEYELDRIDNSKDYSPENCRWATREQQCNNRGDFNIIYEYDGLSMTLKQWAKHLGIKYTTLYFRLTRAGMSFEKAISTRVNFRHKLTKI
jgi:hypothetical protein